jgi:hypothetical protein
MSAPDGPAGADGTDVQAPRREPPWSRGDGGPLDRPNPMRLRGFVPVDELEPVVVPGRGARTSDRPAAPARNARRRRDGLGTARSKVVSRLPAASENVGGVVDDWETRVSLFGEADG